MTKYDKRTVLWMIPGKKIHLEQQSDRQWSEKHRFHLYFTFFQSWSAAARPLKRTQPILFLRINVRVQFVTSSKHVNKTSKDN